MAEASQTESELLDRAQAGDASAYGELIRRNQDYIYNAVYHLVGSEPDAEDLAQDVFVKAFKAIDRFRRQSKFSTWLYGIMLNTVRNHWRRKRTIYSLEAGGDEDSSAPDPESPDDGPAEMARRRERVRAVRRAIARISEDLREILVLRDLQGLTYEQLQETLDLPAGTVKSRLYRARAALKDELAGGSVAPSADEI